MRRFLVPALVMVFSVLPAGVVAQQGGGADEPLRVFVDCQWECDLDFIRTELDWVSYMRDRADAQVHVLVTAQTTGGGGRHFTFNFIGLRSFDGVGDTLTFTASADDSQDVRRRGMVRVLSLGLVPFVARTPHALTAAPFATSSTSRSRSPSTFATKRPVVAPVFAPTSSPAFRPCQAPAASAPCDDLPPLEEGEERAGRGNGRLDDGDAQPVNGDPAASTRDSARAGTSADR